MRIVLAVAHAGSRRRSCARRSPPASCTRRSSRRPATQHGRERDQIREHGSRRQPRMPPAAAQRERARPLAAPSANPASASASHQVRRGGRDGSTRRCSAARARSARRRRRTSSSGAGRKRPLSAIHEQAGARTQRRQHARIEQRGGEEHQRPCWTRTSGRQLGGRHGAGWASLRNARSTQREDLEQRAHVSTARLGNARDTLLQRSRDAA